MNKFDVKIRMEKLRDQRSQWLTAQRQYRDGYNAVLDRLLLEGARAYMTTAQMADVLGVPAATLRTRLRMRGVISGQGKGLMSDRAGQVLAENAELMGVDIDKFDLTSMLAYLPMGDQMRREMQPQGVTDLDDSANEALRRLLDQSLNTANDIGRVHDDYETVSKELARLRQAAQ